MSLYQPTTAAEAVRRTEKRLNAVERRGSWRAAFARLLARTPPAGTIQMFAGAAAPAGWALADGTAISRADNPLLFAAIGTTFGVGNGTTTFNLPNLKGRVPVGRDAAQTEFDVLGETGGAKTHTLTAAEMPTQVPVLVPGAFQYYWNANVSQPDRANNGGGGAHNNLQPYLVLNYIVKLG